MSKPVITSPVLEISFYGPFFFNFQTVSKGFVNICVPKCDGHAAEIFSAKLAYPLRGRKKNGDFRIYEISGQVFKNPGNTVLPSFAPSIINATKDARPDCKTAHFTLHVPVPQLVSPLITAPMEVVKGSATRPSQILNEQATGLRFYYQADFSSGNFLTVSCGKGLVWKTDFDVLYPGQNGDVTVRYAQSGPEDSDHRDSEECFCRIAELAGVDYWLCHEDSTIGGAPGPLVRTGDDCNAGVIIVTEP